MAPDLRLTPDMFHRNAFAILGVASDISTDEVPEAAEKMIDLIKDGDTAQLRAHSVGGFTPIGDSASIADAVLRLSETASRICDEIFWFHPGTEGPGRHLLRGSMAPPTEIAIWRWIEEEAFGTAEISLSATHNLAVFHMIVALEIEAQIASQPESGPLTRALRTDAAVAWSQTVSRWRLLEASDPFRAWLKGRLTELSPDDLNVDHKGTIGHLLNVGLRDLMRGVAEEYGNDERISDQNRILDLMAATGLTEVLE